MGILGFILMIAAYFILWLSTPVWIVKGTYDLVKTDGSFWLIVFSNAGFWLLSMIVGFILLGIGYALGEWSK